MASAARRRLRRPREARALAPAAAVAAGQDGTGEGMARRGSGRPANP
ncbi:hypothetical protein ADP8_05224 (plasmid) [Roseomonas mucosa]|nr:hypothetical protein ADP8_05224 [Roseomonas mucosa]